MATDPIKQIIQSKLPGYRLVEQQQARPEHDAAEAVTDANALRAKFGASDAGLDKATAPAAKKASAKGDDVQMVQVEPENTPAGGDPIGGRKTVIVSKKDKRIIGMQG